MAPFIGTKDKPHWNARRSRRDRAGEREWFLILGKKRTVPKNKLSAHYSYDFRVQSGWTVELTKAGSARKTGYAQSLSPTCTCACNQPPKQNMHSINLKRETTEQRTQGTRRATGNTHIRYTQARVDSGEFV